MKYRVGRKQQRAVLDEEGHEIVVFKPKYGHLAQKFCDLLNEDESKIK
jgi:hypothetical protein